MYNMYYRTTEVELLKKYVKWLNWERKSFDKKAYEFNLKRVVSILCDIKFENIIYNEHEIILLGDNQDCMEAKVKVFKELLVILEQKDLTIDMEYKDPFLKYVPSETDVAFGYSFVFTSDIT